jgi:uncharacterized protein (TIGR01777 family)
MKLVIAGGTGFLGNALAWTWAEEGHDVRVLTRSVPAGQARHESGTGTPGITNVGWVPDGRQNTLLDEVDGAAAIVNLAGASINGGRWTATRKQLIRDSRVLATGSLATTIAMAASPPSVFVSASAVGYYGNRGNETLSEDAASGDDFMAHVCAEWEAEARRAVRDGVRVVTLRTGLVLEKSGGVLPEMARPFRFLVGGPIGSGRQYISWIHRHDWIELVRWIVDTPAIRGPVNATAPHPVTNAEFSRALGRALHRPALVPAPRLAVRMVIGEMADAIFASQRAIPGAALSHGYHFRYPEIDIAFRGIYSDS